MACTRTFRPTLGDSAADTTVVSVQLLPRNAGQLVVCTKSNTVYIMGTDGHVLRTFTNEKTGTSGLFLACCTSPRGEWLYCLAEDGTLYCFHVATGEMRHSFVTHEKGVIGLTHHPHQNIIATYAEDRHLKLWTA